VDPGGQFASWCPKRGERLQHNTGSDLLAIRRPFRYLIELGVPILFAGVWARHLGWVNGNAVVLWPGFLAAVFAAVWVRFDLQLLVRQPAYRLSAVNTLFNRSFAVVVVGSLAFVVDGSWAQHWHELGILALGVWLCVLACTILLVELAVLPVFRRPAKRLAIAAITETSIAFAQSLNHQRFLALQFEGFFEDRTPSRLPDYAPFTVLCRLDELESYLAQHEMHHVLVSLPTQASYRFGFVLEQLLNSTCSVHYLHDFLLFRPIREAMTAVGNMSVFTIIDSPAADFDQIIKRGIDIFGALAALVVLSPLLLFVGLWIKLDSSGPALFKQNRWGAGALPFQIYKFRSMTHNTSLSAANGETVIQTTRQDARVTKVGAFIRRTSIDELPQLINILKGDMSFVGPRPHAAGHNKEYRGLIKGYMLRHKVKPGLTGWAQIHGFRGETDTLDKMEDRVTYDLEYLRSWTPLLDVYILLNTVWIVISGKNAY
jgi:putative colanic acid biosynthesis UDP-glucose lipid carrier transferase